MGDEAEYYTEMGEVYLLGYGEDDEIEQHFNMKGDFMPDLVIENALLSYLNWFEPQETPSGDMKFSVSILTKKNDEETLSQIKATITAAVNKGIADNKFTKEQARSLRIPLRDGSAEYKTGNRGKEYDGHFFMNANNKRKPGVVRKDGDNTIPITDPDEFYSGCTGHVHVTLYAYNTAGNRGIGVSLNNIMKISDGDRFDGRKSASDAFSDYDGGDDDAIDPENDAF